MVFERAEKKDVNREEDDSVMIVLNPTPGVAPSLMALWPVRYGTHIQNVDALLGCCFYKSQAIRIINNNNL